MPPAKVLAEMLIMRMKINDFVLGLAQKYPSNKKEIKFLSGSLNRY